MGLDFIPSRPVSTSVVTVARLRVDGVGHLVRKQNPLPASQNRWLSIFPRQVQGFNSA
jgi:hypothetical protein